MIRTHVEPLGRVRTKIVATVGPASDDPETLRRLIEAGVDCFRLNASHTKPEERSAMLARARAAAEAVGTTVAVLLDLGGPKLRLGPIPGDAVECPLGAHFRLVKERDGDDPRALTCTYRDLPDELRPGDRVLFADGTVAMEVTDARHGAATLEVTLPGRLRSGQGLNLPGASLRLASLTEADLADLDWLRENPVDYVGLSFARSADDVERLRDELAARGLATPIVAKIEKPQAVEHFDAILVVTDAVMVARGDLGVEMDVERVPAVQKRILAACHRARVPVITATQMLQSMEDSSRPTRAEASDVFNAVLDGTDAVMLSGETAIGRYPVEAVATMSRIVAEAETLLPDYRRDPGPIPRSGWITPITEAVVEAAGVACRKLGAALLVVATHSGRTALAASKQRHVTPTLALTQDAETARRLALYWGVTPMPVDHFGEIEQALSFAHDWALQRGLIRKGDRVVLIRGTIPGSAVQNALVVQEVG
jgi:pyruvate kinase